MRILAIGDIHGKDIWKRVVDNVAADVIVFIGDYINAKQWIGGAAGTENLQALIDFKKKNPRRVKLLVGNHDHFFLYRKSFLRQIFFPVMSKAFNDNEALFDIAYGHQRYLFTHAGLSTQWYNKHSVLLENGSALLSESLNQLSRSSRREILFEKGEARGGSDPFGGPIYADKSETEKAFLKGYTQIVGHTKVAEPLQYRSQTGSIIYIDCLNSQNQFLLISNNEIFTVNAYGDPSPIAEREGESLKLKA